jgi:hypothetical protein
MLDRLKGICKRAGIKAYTVHALRHSFGTYLRMSGVSLPDIADLMGHADIRTTQIYAKVMQEHLRREIAKLAPLAELTGEVMVPPKGATSESRKEVKLLINQRVRRTKGRSGGETTVSGVDPLDGGASTHGRVGTVVAVAPPQEVAVRRRVTAWILGVLFVLGAGLTTTGSAADVVEILLNGTYFSEPATVRFLVAVEPNGANRVLWIEADKACEDSGGVILLACAHVSRSVRCWQPSALLAARD